MHLLKKKNFITHNIFYGKNLRSYGWTKLKNMKKVRKRQLNNTQLKQPKTATIMSKALKVNNVIYLVKINKIQESIYVRYQSFIITKRRWLTGSINTFWLQSRNGSDSNLNLVGERHYTEVSLKIKYSNQFFIDQQKIIYQKTFIAKVFES